MRSRHARASFLLAGLLAGVVCTVCVVPAWGQAKADAPKSAGQDKDRPDAKKGADKKEDAAPGKGAVNRGEKDAREPAKGAVPKDAREATKDAREATKDAREAQKDAREATKGAAPKDAPRLDDKTKGSAKGAAQDARDTAKDAREATKEARDTAKDARDTAKEARDTAKDATKDTRDAAKDASRDKRDPAPARDTAKDARESTRDTAKDAAARDRTDDRQTTDRQATGRQTRQESDRRSERRDFRAENVRSADVGLWFETSNQGLVISDVASSGAIARFGFREGDRIVSVNGQQVTREADFVSYLFAPDIREQRVKVIVIRGGREEIVYVEPAVLIEQYTVVDVDPLEEFGIVIDDRYTDRVVIWKVIPRSPAFYAGIRSGDVITTFDGRRVTAVNDLVQVVSQSRANEIAVGVNRNQASRQMRVDMSSVREGSQTRTSRRETTEQRDIRQQDRRDERQEGRDDPRDRPRTEGRDDKRDDRRDAPRTEDRKDVRPEGAGRPDANPGKAKQPSNSAPGFAPDKGPAGKGPSDKGASDKGASEKADKDASDKGPAAKQQGAKGSADQPGVLPKNR